MPHPRSGFSRLFSSATLLTALCLPMIACAQGPKETTVAADASPAKTAPVKKAVPQAHPSKKHPANKTAAANQAEPTKGPKQAKKPKKTPEELAKEKEKKEIEKLQHEARLQAARLKAELAPLQLKKQRMEAEISFLQAEQRAAQAKIKLAQAQADFEYKLKADKIERQLKELKLKEQKRSLTEYAKKLEHQRFLEDISTANAKLAAESSALQAKLSHIQTQRSAASIAQDPIQYPAQPLAGKVLTISDRRIPLSGPIGVGTANYVTERIHYFNNLDPKAPIFIVIDRSPGGSVMEGFRIVTAMENSKAPVHVVVKSFAASMAAVITTLAEESYAYPNAILLHHQMSSGMSGNLTQQKEWLEDGQKWSTRLAGPVAKKMGVTEKEFVKLMYKNNSDGDWAEFADKAKKLKWVNHVVTEIRETALVKAPHSTNYVPRYYFTKDAQPATANAPQQAQSGPRALTQAELFQSPISFPTKVDGNGRSYIELPALAPYDYYFMHDPAGQYRMAK